MRPLLPFLLLVSSPALAADPGLVVLTAFEPFQGRRENGSQVVAELVRQDPSLAQAGIRIEVCVLPVEYDRAAQVAMDCLSRIGARPRMVVSLGERGCGVFLETRYHNLDDTEEPDNRRVLRRRQVIVPGGPAELPSTLPLLSMHCGLPATGLVQPELSIDAGNYVCNNTAYRLQSSLRAHQLPYGFIHVPMATCGRSYPQAAARIVAQLLARGVTSLPEPGQPISRTPVNREELLREVAGPGFTVADSCGARFYQQLATEYAPVPRKPR